MAGELCLGGRGVARGYLGDPALTAERFVPDPFAGGAGARLYRTGDRVRWPRDGELQFLGRFDDQVQARGVRVEPGEVESALGSHPAVREACVVAHGPPDGDVRLVAYVVPREARDGLVAELRSALRRRLHPAMVPASWVVLDALPRSVSGKVVRAALPPPGAGEAAATPSPDPPADELERRIADVWREVLGVPRVGREQSFFELGGHSLVAPRISARLRSALGVEVPLSLLFDEPTVAGVAAAVRGTAERVRPSPLVRLSTAGDEPPLFLVHGGGGLVNFARLLAGVDASRPYYGLRSLGLDAGEVPLDDVGSMADRYVEAVRAVQPAGPYRLGGFCIGGSIAAEMAVRLDRLGERVDALLLFESASPGTSALVEDVDHESTRFAYEATIAHQAGAPGLEAFRAMAPPERARLILEMWRDAGLVGKETSVDFIDRYLGVCRANAAAGRAHRMSRPRPGRAVLFRGRDGAEPPEELGWRPLLPDLRVVWVQGGHVSIFFPPNVESLAAEVDAALRGAAGTSGTA